MPANADIYVTFGADTGGLEAALALTKANVQGMTRELGSLARQMRTTGAGAESELGEKMRALGAQIAAAKGQARDISGQMGGFSVAIRESGVAAMHGGTGLGFYLREMHALSDEFGSGRTRQGIGTLSNLIFTFLQSHTALIPYAAAVGAIGAAFGYVAYEAYSAASAVKSIELGAATNEFAIADAASAKLRDSIEKLANVGASTAAEIVKPFEALGPAGEIVAQLVSPHLQNLAAAMGKTVPEAAAEVAKYFVDLGGAGSKLIHSSTLLTQAQKQQYDAFVAAGDKGRSYGEIVDLLAQRWAGYEAKALAAKQVTDADRAALAAAGAAGDSMGVALGYLAEREDETGARADALKAKIAELRGQLAGAASGAREMAQALEAGVETALKVDRVSAELKKTNEEIATLEKGIKAAGGAAAPAAAEQVRALDMARDHLKGLQDQFAGGLLGGNALERVHRTNEELANSFKGAPADLLRQQLAPVQAIANDPSKDAKTRADAALEASRLTRQIRDAEFEEANAKDQQRVTAAGKNSAAVIAIRENEVKRAIAAYGDGSRQADAAEERLARAKEQGAERGAKAAAKGAKDELAATEESVNGQIQKLEGLTRGKLADLQAQLKLKQITAKGEETAAVGALKAEEQAVDALYAKELALAGLTSQKKDEILNKEAAFNRSVALQIQQVQARAAEASQRAWEGATRTINSAFDGQVDGLLRGTESWSQAFRNVLASLTEDLTKFFVNWGLQAVEAEARQMFAQNAVTQAHVAGNAAMAASDQASAASGALAWVGNALKAIAADAAQAFGGVFAFLAPVMGPAAVGPAAAAQAAVMGAGGAIASADIGMWQVPGDQLAMIHHNELIMPAPEAGAFRGMLSAMAGGGSGGGGDTHYHHYGDIVSNARDPRQVAREVVAELNRNPSFRPKY